MKAKIPVCPISAWLLHTFVGKYKVTPDSSYLPDWNRPDTSSLKKIIYAPNSQFEYEHMHHWTIRKI